MRGVRLAAVVVALVTVVTARAHAEHLTLMPEARAGEPTSPSVDVQFRIGDGGFRLGARVFGDRGGYGAWLNGHVDADGFTLDGRVQDPDKGHSFTVDSRALEALLREAARGLSGF
jgi:hypothetical protein